MAQRTVGTVNSQGGLRWSTSSGNVAAHRVSPPTTGRWWPCRLRCPSGCWISVRMVCCWLARPPCASARQCGSYPGLPGGGWRSNSASVTRPADEARRLAVASSAGASRRSTRRPGKSSLRCSPRAYLVPPGNRLPVSHKADQRRRPLAASGASVLLGGRGRLGRTNRPGSPRHPSASSNRSLASRSWRRPSRSRPGGHPARQRRVRRRHEARRRGRRRVGLHGRCHRQTGGFRILDFST